MIEAEVQWEASDPAPQVRAAAWQRLQRAVVLLWTEMVRAVGVPNPRPYKTPSRPGEPPRLRTAEGQRGIVYELDEAAGEGRIGVTPAARHMLFLDRGTARVEARPWGMATVKKCWARLQALLRG